MGSLLTNFGSGIHASRKMVRSITRICSGNLLSKGWTGSAFRWRPTKTKNLRVVLPRDDAEDLIWKPESRCKIVASYGPFDLSWTQAHRRGGQAVNPSQVGFHLIKREWPLIPFTPRRKNAILSTREFLAPCLACSILLT